MGRIQLLNEEVSSRIAAGEVVERPASVVKELIENSIDAKATQISVSIKEGGVKEIRIADNGSGILEEDMAYTILKHATSKIYRLEDLQHISSMGFRGEALASIAAVSYLTIKSKAKDTDEIGNELYSKGGKISEIKKSGLPDGTTVIVENLFFNTPARLKFLKKPSYEAALITDIVQKQMLAHPEIAFRYLIDDKLVYRTSGNGSLEDVILTLYGFALKNSLIRVSYKFNSTYLDGYIAAPTFAYRTSKYETFFVNNRYIKSSFANMVVQRAYGERLMKGNYPFFVLNLSISPEDIDVNIHPNKLAVSFRDESTVEYILTNAVDIALTKSQHTPEMQIKSTYLKQKPASAASDSSTASDSEKNTPSTEAKRNEPDNETYVANSDIKFEKKSFIEKRRELMTGSSEEPVKKHTQEEANRQVEKIMRLSRELANKYKDKPLEDDDKLNTEVFVSDATEPTNLELKKPAAEKQEVKQDAPFFFEDNVEYVLRGVAFNTYIMAESGDNLYIIDQHAAHERKLYDSLLKNIVERPLSQRLLAPIRTEITPSEAILIKDNLDILNPMGFEFDEINDSYISVIAFPYVIGETDVRKTVEDMVESLESGDKSFNIRKDKIAKGACKRAVKGGNDMSDADIKELISTIRSTRAIPHCPHGRPICMVLTKKDFEEGFKRIV